MTSLQKTKLSMLDLVAVREGGTVAEALAIARDTARHVEQLGFTRYWVAEHHNMPGIASSATAVLVGYIAGATSRIRVGSGGIMLPNMRRWSLPRPSARSLNCIQAASTLALVAPRAPTV